MCALRAAGTEWCAKSGVPRLALPVDASGKQPPRVGSNFRAWSYPPRGSPITLGDSLDNLPVLLRLIGADGIGTTLTDDTVGHVVIVDTKATGQINGPVRSFAVAFIRKVLGAKGRDIVVRQNLSLQPVLNNLRRDVNHVTALAVELADARLMRGAVNAHINAPY